MVKTFIAYSSKNINYKQKLKEHLASLETGGYINMWSDDNILPGEEWDEKIIENLEESHMILPLVSSNFFSSNYCVKEEMKRAVQRHEKKEAIVIPIIIEPCNWEVTPFGKLQVLPTGKRPVSEWENEHKAYEDISKGIQKRIEYSFPIRDIIAYNEITRDTFPDEQKRVAEKDKFRQQSGEFIANKPYSKKLISRINNEGALVALLYSLQLAPNIEDKNFLFENYEKATHPHSKHTVLNAIIKFFQQGYIQKSDCNKATEILTNFEKDADQKLINKIQNVKNESKNWLLMFGPPYL